MNKIIAIAIDKYSKAPQQNLSNCLNDVNSILSILTSEYDFEYEESQIQLLSEPEQTTLSYIYKCLNQEFYNALELDTLLIIYAGHGEYNDHLKTGYWLCSDSIFDDPTTWFDINTLLSFFLHSKAKNIALISDSCFSGAIFNKTRGGGINALTKNRSRQALTSGGLEKVSDGDPNDNSPFNKAIQLTLKDNILQDLSFSAFCEKTILNFPLDKRQTPDHGALKFSGDEGGAYIFRKKNISQHQLSYQNISLALEVDKRIKIDSNINIPFFLENPNFDSKYINSFIQRLGYKIINDIRIYTLEDIDYLIESSLDHSFEVDSGYTIQRLDQDYLSICFSQYEFFGSPHPNYYMNSINFKLNPHIIQVGLYDIFDINYNEELEYLIYKYAEDDAKEILITYVEENSTSDLDFSFDDQNLSLYFVNHLPHVFKACGTVEIPLSEVTFK